MFLSQFHSRFGYEHVSVQNARKNARKIKKGTLAIRRSPSHSNDMEDVAAYLCYEDINNINYEIAYTLLRGENQNRIL